MNRYVPRSWSTWSEEGLQERPSMTVIEDDPEPRWTGLYDSAEVPIYRTFEKPPIGFRGKGCS